MNCKAEKCDNIKVSTNGDIYEIVLDRSGTCNALNLPMMHALCDALETAELDDNIKVVLISGAGEHFCSGGDVKLMQSESEMFSGSSAQLVRQYRRGVQRIPRTIEHMRTPIIAAVNGPAAGAGCDLTAMCDLRIGSTGAKFAASFVKIGLVSGDGGSYFLSRVVGYAKAMEMALTGRLYSADQALEMGLLNEIVAEDKLLDRAREVCNEIASHSPTATQMAKQLMKVAWANHSLENVLELAGTQQGIAHRT